MSDLFISYAEENREIAAQLAGALEQVGWTVWWDREIPTGRVFADVIKEELDRATCVLVLWSRQSVGSTWVRREATAAMDQQKLFPILVDRVGPPWEFSDLHACDFVDWNGGRSAVAFERLIKDLQRLLKLPASEAEPDDAETLVAPSPQPETPVDAVDPKMKPVPKGKSSGEYSPKAGSILSGSGAGIGAAIGGLQAIAIFTLAEQFVSYLFGLLVVACWVLAGALSGTVWSRMLVTLAGFVAGGVLWNSIWAWVGWGNILGEWNKTWWFLIGGAIGAALSQVIATVWARTKSAA